jgi:hypothetical protein
MLLFIEEYTSVFFFSTVRCNRSFDTVPFYRLYIWLDIIAMDRYRYYRSFWLPIVSIHRLKNFHFWPIVSIIGSKKKNILIESNHRLKIFFSSKDHRSNRYFLQLIDYRYRSNRCFFRHRCPTMAGTQQDTNLIGGTGGGAVRNSSVTGGQGGQVRTAPLHIQHVSVGLAAQRQRGDHRSFADESR